MGSTASGLGLEHAFDDFTPFIRTAGGLNAAASDIAAWLIALQDGKLLKRETLTAMWTPGHFVTGQPTPWSMGWPLNTRKDHPVASGIGGRRSAFCVYSKDDLAIVVLTNLAGANPEEFIDEIAGRFTLISCWSMEGVIFCGEDVECSSEQGRFQSSSQQLPRATPSQSALRNLRRGDQRVGWPFTA